MTARLRRVSLLGRGSSGEVWRCRDARLGNVAVKFLHDDLGSSQRERLRREHHVLSTVRHRNVVKVLELREEPRFALVLELVSGRTFLDALGAPAMTPEQRGERWFIERLTGLLLQLLDGLGAVHGAGLVHRDIKPGNVLVTTAGVVKLLDLGMAVGIPRGATGTLRYMAPELLLGAVSDLRADLYAVGAIAYEALGGDVPHGDTARAASAQVFASTRASQPATPISTLNPAVPTSLAEAIARLVASEPSERPWSAAEAARLLAHSTAYTNSRPETTTVDRGITLLQPPLIAREEELQSLTVAAGRAFAGDGSSSVAVVGPAGSGKTRLVETWAKGLDSRVLVLRVNGRGEPRPFAAFVPAIEEIAFALASLDPRKAAAIVPRRARCLLPLSHRVRDLPGFDFLPPAFAPGDDEPARIVEVVSELVDAAASLRPVLLLVEDVEAMSDVSRRILARMATPRAARLALVTTTREAPPTGIERDGRLTLADLDADAVAAVVAGSLDAPATPALLAWVKSKSGGSPGAAVDALATLVSAQATVRRGGFVDLDPDRAAGVEVGSWATAILEGLAPPARAVAAVLAIVDQPATLDHIAALAGQSPRRTAQGLTELLGARAVEETAGGARLTRMALRDAIVAALDPAVSRRIHLAAARAAERDGHELEAISHRLAAGGVKGVVPRLAAAANTSRVLGDSQRAQTWASAGLEELRQRARPNLLIEAELRIARAHAAMQRADYETWDTDLARVSTIEALHPLPLTARADLLDTLRDVAYRRGESAALIPQLEAHLARTAASGDHALTARAHEGLSSALFATGDSTGAEQHLAEALQLYRSLGDEERMGRALGARGVHELRHGRWSAGERHLRRALTIARRHGAKTQVLNLLGNLGGLYHTMGRTLEAIRYNREMVELARAIGDLARTAQAQSSFATALLVIGQYGEAASHFDEAERGLVATHNRRALPGVALGRGALLIRVGDFRGALANLDQAVAEIDLTGLAEIYRPKALFLRAEAARGAGDRTAAERDVAAARAHGLEHKVDWTDAEAEFLLALLAHDRGDSFSVLRAAPAVISDAERRRDLPILARMRALAALHQGDVAEARRAIDVATESGDVAAELEARAALVTTLITTRRRAEGEAERAVGAELVSRVATWSGPHRESFLALAHVRGLMNRP